MHQASAPFQEHQGLPLTNVDDVTQDQPKEALINALADGRSGCAGL
jgi:hypothetical protein